MFNISAAYVCESFKGYLEQLFPYMDVVFGNDQEFTAFADAFNLQVGFSLRSLIFVFFSFGLSFYSQKYLFIRLLKCNYSFTF